MEINVGESRSPNGPDTIAIRCAQLEQVLDANLDAANSPG